MVLVTDLQFYMNKHLRSNLKEIPRFLKKGYDAVIIVTGHGKVRVGKCLYSGVTIKVIENGKVINKKLSEFKDGDFINTLSWDFKNNKQVESISEVIVEKDEKDFFEIELENGKKVICTKDHKLFVKRGKDIVELKLKDIKEGDEICQN